MPDSRLLTTASALDISKLQRRPVVRITPERSPPGRQLSELWQRRELLLSFIWRDLKVRYRQTFLGAAWVILQPLLMTLAFAIFLSKLGHFQSEGVPYPLFAYAGLLPWTFFSNSVLAGSVSMLTNSYLINKVYFPRLMVPAAIVGVRLVDFLVASIALVALMLFYHVGIGRSMLFLPLVVVEVTILSLAVSSWFSALSVRYRDVNSLLPVLMQLWMFASPIIYPINMVPEQWRWIYSLNPLVGIVEAFRAALFGLPFMWPPIVSAAFTLATITYVFYDFHSRQDALPDML